MTVIVNDLELYGERGILQFDQVREIVWKAKEDVLRKSVNLHSPDELILIEPVGEVVFYEQLLRILNLIKDLPSVKIYTSYDVFDMLLLPENIEVFNINDLQKKYDFSSSPINNKPTVMIDGEVKEIDVNPVWIVDVIPTDDNPVKTLESFLKDIDAGMVVTVVRAPIRSSEKELMETMLEEYNGLLISLVEDVGDTSSEIEEAFSENISRRLSRYLGLKLLRGEEL